MTTPLYPIFDKRITDAINQLIKDQIEPWVFLNTGHPLQLKMFNGRIISYQGIGFEGSPRVVFWSQYIEPFLEELTVQQLSAAVKEARERSVDARLLLPEIQNLLLAACRSAFMRMAEIDRNLLGKGFPEKIQLRSTSLEYAAMQAFVNKHVNAELEMWKPKHGYEEWYERNKFFVWIVGIVIAAASLLVKFL